MSQPIPAIYHEGQLHLLEAVDLSEGQAVQVVILSEQQRVREALHELLVVHTDFPQDDLDEDALMREIEEGFRGQPPLSETIIEERRESP
jgi:predicted DNA-binding antitoxin AbrB/MazE fold protein